MIKMIIADDETVIIRGIRKLLDWQGLGIEIVGEYTDGKLALEGILALKPDIALLDISMPGLSGIQVLKELRDQNEKTNVIFISGFQDFEYAKDAVRFGAKDYLLKPIIREELLTALERCAPLNSTKEPLFSMEKDYSALLGMEENCYVTMVAVPLLAGKEGQIRRLIQFSLIGELEECLKREGRGIQFEKEGNIVVILKGMDRAEALSYVTELETCLFEKAGVHVCFLAAGLTDSLSHVREQYDLCLAYRDLPFFAHSLKQYVFDLPLREEDEEKAMEELMKTRQEMRELLLSQKKEDYQKAYQRLCRRILRSCAYSRENACYYFCSTLRLFGEKLKEARIEFDELDVKNLLEAGRRLESFEQMTKMFESSFLQLFEKVQKKAASSERKEIDLAAEYIESHYMVRRTLEIMAGVVHMNSYYFSSYFKKNMGINFKDYLGQVRLRHALPLLVSTDLTTYEIAREVGFADARAFSDLFQKTYGEKPSAYRKRIRKNQ